MNKECSYEMCHNCHGFVYETDGTTMVIKCKYGLGNDTTINTIEDANNSKEQEKEQ